MNIANLASPNLIAAFTAPSSAIGVDFDPQTGIAAVAMGTAGLQLADILTPASPKLRGVLLGGNVQRVLIKYPAVLLADTQRSVTGVDITNAAAPVVSSSLRADLGGAPVDIAAFGNTAITADISFGRAVPIIGISDPLKPAALTFWNYSSGGFSSSIAMDNSFGYLVVGNSILHILKYQDITDTFGKPPAVQITSPVGGTPLIHGQTVTLAVNAIDDVAVASVNFLD